MGVRSRGSGDRRLSRHDHDPLLRLEEPACGSRAWTAPSARDKGVGSAAFRLLLDWAFDGLGLERIEITALPENVSIPHLAEKFGFTYEGTLRKRNFERGRRVDLLLWSLLKEERQHEGPPQRTGLRG